jgi:hypothetical protein
MSEICETSSVANIVRYRYTWRNSYARPFWLLAVILSVHVFAAALNAQPSPTPCFPDRIRIQFNPELLKDTYEPGETLTFEVLPVTVDEWPTSPSFR